MGLRRLLIGVAAVAAALAIVALPLLLGGDDPERPARGGTIASAHGAGGTDIGTPEAEPVAAVRPPRRAKRLVPPARGIYFGASSYPILSGAQTIDSWARAHGARPRIVNWYQQWLSGERRFRADWARRVADQGAVPMITWEPWYAPAGEPHVAEQPRIRLARIAGGGYDGYIRSWARAVAAYKRPVMIRLMHEANGFWYPWGVSVNGNTPALYVRAWRRVHRIFDAAGARNATWIWSINNLEGPPGEGQEVDRFYPGARWVDWVSTSGFNWGEAYEWSSWRDADALYGLTYSTLSRYRKPIMISEIGTTDIGGDPHAWIGASLERLRTGYPLLRAVVWYDDVDAAALDFRLRGATARSLAQPGALGRGWLRPLRLRTLPA